MNLDITPVTTFIKSNPWVIGGFSFIAGGSFVAAIKEIPIAIFQGIRRQCILSLDITDETGLYNIVLEWLNDHNYSKKTRLVTANIDDDDDDNNRPDKKQNVYNLKMTPAPGNHFIWHKRKLIWMNRYRRPSNAGNHKSYIQGFEIICVGRNQKFLRTFLEEIIKSYAQKHEDKISLHANVDGCWRLVKELPQRELSSVILKENEMENIINDLIEFQSNEEWYHKLGIPYHRGYLLYGLPGTGKSSLIQVLAQNFKKNLYVINLCEKYMSDATLANLILRMPHSSFLLLEDIDVVFKSREEIQNKTDYQGNDSEVTLSGLLNVLDGVVAKSGIITFMTTNYKEKLDTALIRPGRIDYELEFTYADKFQFKKMFERFYPNAGKSEMTELLKIIQDKKMTMAQIQMIFLKNKDNPKGAIKDVAKI